MKLATFCKHVVTLSNRKDGRTTHTIILDKDGQCPSLTEWDQCHKLKITGIWPILTTRQLPYKRTGEVYPVVKRVPQRCASTITLQREFAIEKKRLLLEGTRPKVAGLIAYMNVRSRRNDRESGGAY